MPKVIQQKPASSPTIAPQSNGQPQSAMDLASCQKQAQSAWDFVDYVKILLYGDSGTGKTTLWATFPGPILALICSGSSRPGELRSINTPEYRKKIDARVITSTEDYGNAIATVKNFKTVVLDHASGYIDLLIKEKLGLDDIAISKYRKANKGESWSILSMGQWGEIGTETITALRDLLNLPCNVVVIAQERVFSPKDEGIDPGIMKPKVGAAVTPTVMKWLYPTCDYVLQTFIRQKVKTTMVPMEGGEPIPMEEPTKDVEYCLRTKPHATFRTKFRITRDKADNLPECIINPTWQKIDRLIKGEKI